MQVTIDQQTQEKIRQVSEETGIPEPEVLDRALDMLLLTEEMHGLRALPNSIMTKGEIWVSDLPAKGGHVQRGVRPALIIANATKAIALVIPINWLRVSGTAELAQIDQRVCQQLHAIMPPLDTFKSE